jgi:hypothetical protein
MACGNGIKPPWHWGVSLCAGSNDHEFWGDPDRVGDMVLKVRLAVA